MLIELKITWIEIVKVIPCSNLKTINEIKKIYEEVLRLTNSEIRFFKDPNLSMEIADGRLKLQQLSDQNTLEIWASINFSNASLIQVNVKSNDGLAYQTDLNPTYDLFSVKRILKEQNAGWDDDKITFKNAFDKREDLSKNIYHLLIAEERVRLNVFLAAKRKHARKTKSHEADPETADSFAVSLELMQSYEIIEKGKCDEERKSNATQIDNVKISDNEKRYSNTKIRNSEKKSRNKINREKMSSNEESRSNGFHEYSGSSLEEMINFEDSSDTKSSENYGLKHKICF